MGKHYSAAADSNAVAHANSSALANLGIDIVAFAFWFAGSITLGDVRVSDRKPESRPVNTAAARAKRGGCPAWIRTKNNASKGRCVTVTPQGKVRRCDR